MSDEKDAASGSGWGSASKWAFGIIWGGIGALALGIAWPYGQDYLLPTAVVFVTPILLLAFGGLLSRTFGGVAAFVFVVAGLAALGWAGYSLKMLIDPDVPAAAGTASEDARLDLWIDLRPASAVDAEYRNAIRLADGAAFEVRIGVQNLSLLEPVRDAAIEFRTVQEPGGIVRLIAEVSAPGFPPQRETATVQAEIASPADVGFFAEELVWVSTKSAEGEAPRLVLDTLDDMRQTWHIPVVPRDPDRNEVVLNFTLLFNPGSVTPPAAG